MACDFVVMVRDADQSLSRRSVADVVLDALESVDAIEQLLTVYDTHSEVSAINHAAGMGPVSVSVATFAVLQHALRLGVSTDGGFDITAGPLIDAWGFTTRQGRKPTGEEIASARELIGMDQLRLDPERRTAELLRPGMRINLARSAKATPSTT